MPEAKKRVLAFLRKSNVKIHKASAFASIIWPDVEFTSQGGGAAASRILKALEKDGLVKWISVGSRASRDQNWGWTLI